MILGVACIYCQSREEFERNACLACQAMDGVVHSYFLQAQKSWSEITLPFSALQRQIKVILEKHFPGLFRSGPADQETRRKAVDWLPSLKWEELFLTTACSLGDGTAWEIFLARYRSLIEKAARCTAENATAAQDLAGTLLSELFLPAPSEDDTAASKISQYHGIGSLEGWLRVVIARRAIDNIRSSKKQVPLEELEASPAMPASPDCANALVEARESRKAADLFANAFQEAWGQLSSQEKLALKLYYLEDVNLKEIGKLIGAHESTASRLLEKVKMQLRKNVEKVLRVKYKVKPNEVFSLIENGQSNAEMDFGKLLAK